METMVIGIAGGSGSGKTTLTNRLQQAFGDDVSVIYHDNYYKSHNDMTDNEKFEGFKQELIDRNEAQYGSETRAAYGDEAIDASNKKLKNMPKPATNSKSSAILTRQAVIKKYSGRRVSPTARSTPEPIL